jgi:hypothetical protein
MQTGIEKFQFRLKGNIRACLVLRNLGVTEGKFYGPHQATRKILLRAGKSVGAGKLNSVPSEALGFFARLYLFLGPDNTYEGLNIV